MVRHCGFPCRRVYALAASASAPEAIDRSLGYARATGLDSEWPHMTRYAQILHYVARRQLVDWLALDDDDESWPAREMHRLVRVDAEAGLSATGKAHELQERLVALEHQFRQRTGR